MLFSLSGPGKLCRQALGAFILSRLLPFLFLVEVLAFKCFEPIGVSSSCIRSCDNFELVLFSSTGRGKGCAYKSWVRLTSHFSPSPSAFRCFLLVEKAYKADAYESRTCLIAKGLLSHRRLRHDSV